MQREQVVILIVDDVNTMRLSIKELLRRAGFHKIFAVSNGQEAQAILMMEKVHLILSDWHMAPVDGLELLRYVRKDPNLKNTAFIMVTAEGTKPMVIEAITAGVDDYLLKPLTASQVQDKVFGVLLKKGIF